MTPSGREKKEKKKINTHIHHHFPLQLRIIHHSLYIIKIKINTIYNDTYQDEEENEANNEGRKHTNKEE